MTKKEFYKKLLGDSFSKDFILGLLQDIGKLCVGPDHVSGDIVIDRDGMSVDFDAYDRYGHYDGKYTENIYWEDLTDEFFDEIEREHEAEKEFEKRKGVGNV
jgi:hypothetical protein